MSLKIIDTSEIGTKHGPGLIGIPSNTMSRYVEFQQCLHAVSVSEGTGKSITWQTSAHPATNANNMCREVLANKEYKWLWIIDDDHVFNHDILLKLLGRNVPVINPLCLRRTSPFNPVIHEFKEDGSHPVLGWDYIQGKSGLLSLEGKACGNAGRLIRREVIEQMDGDWFKVGWLNPEVSAPDIYFSKRCNDLGIPAYLDLDNPIGHLTHFAVWPKKDKENMWNVSINQALEFPK